MDEGIIRFSAIVRGGEVKLFLSPSDELGAQLLKKIANGDYEIGEVSANQQLIDKLPQGSLVIQRKTKPEEI